MKGFVVTREVIEGIKPDGSKRYAKRYDACWRVEGRQKLKTFTKRRAAERYLTETEKRSRTATYVEIKPITFKAYAEAWLKGLGDLKPSTRASYQSLMTHRLVPAFGDRGLTTLTVEDVNGWLGTSAERLLRRRCGTPSRSCRSSWPMRRRELPGRQPPERQPSPPTAEGAAGRRGDRDRAPHAGRGQPAPRRLRAGARPAVPHGRVHGRAPRRTPGAPVGGTWTKPGTGCTCDGRRTAARSTCRRGIGREGRSTSGTSSSPCCPDGGGSGTARPRPRRTRSSFPSEAGGAIDPDNLRHRVWGPALATAKLRHVRNHSLRHTFASMLIAQGENVKYIESARPRLGAVTLIATGTCSRMRSESATRFEAQLAAADLIQQPSSRTSRSHQNQPEHRGRRECPNLALTSRQG